MAKSTCKLTINGQEIEANKGETLMDAGLGGRILIPHDCCSGQCETCRVEVLSGEVDDMGTRQGSTVLGCLATVEGDASVNFDPVPPVRTTKGRVESIEAIVDGYLEVKVRTSKPVEFIPGQYVNAAFAGYPGRDYSPAVPLDMAEDNTLITFQIKVYPDSVVSSKLGNKIKAGHSVKLRGPFGSAFFRHKDKPMILASTGTGFAPIWSIAKAVLLAQPGRSIRMLVGARSTKDLYMIRAVEWLRTQGVDVTLTAGDGDDEHVFTRRPYELLGDVSEEHVIYAAGSINHVEGCRQRAEAAGAEFHADPFNQAESEGVFASVTGSISRALFR